MFGYYYSIQSERGRWAPSQSAKGGERLKKVEKRWVRDFDSSTRRS